jgi:hypothetical protein
MMREADAAKLAALVDAAADTFELNQEERTRLRELVAASASDVEGSDGWYWRGPYVAWGWLEQAAERIATGEEPRSWLDYEEARADAAC